MSQSKGKKTYKIIFLGESSVGKTCMIERFVNDIFEDYFNVSLSSLSPPLASIFSVRTSSTRAGPVGFSSGTLRASRSSRVSSLTT